MAIFSPRVWHGLPVAALLLVLADGTLATAGDAAIVGSASSPAAKLPYSPPRPMPGPDTRRAGGAVQPAVRRSLTAAPVAVPLAAATPAVTTFGALGDNQTVTPPDTMGAVGPNHVMTVLNSQVRFQSRSGAVISTFAMNGSASGWPVLGPLNNSEMSDPHIVYDPYGGRWIFTAIIDPESAASAIVVVVSRTSDPTADWNPLLVIPADDAGRVWADFPTLGFNKTWVVVAANMFSIGGNSFQRSRVIAIDKAKLYGGSATIANTTSWDDPNGFTYQPAVTYDPTLDTLFLAQAAASNLNGAGFLQISKITGPVGAETLSSVQQPASEVFASAAPWFSPTATFNTNFAPQLGSAERIDSGDDRLLNCVYRNSALWCAHTVFLPAASPTRSAAQWWQVEPVHGTVLQFGRVDDPAGVNFYAYPTIAANRNDDALLGYSRFSANQYASADFSFRSGSDPANSMRTDTVFKAGEAPYFKTFGGTSNRWGDFSSTVVDPVDDTALWTIQEYAAASAGSVSTWGTQWAQVVPSATAPLPPSVSSVTPAADTAGVAAGSTVTATFSETMDQTSLDAGTFTLSNGGSAVPGTVSTTTDSATFTPSSPLAYGALYTVRVEGARSLGGAALPGFSWNFSTSRFGDVSGDGAVTIADALLTLRFVVGLITFTPNQKLAADVAPLGVGKTPDPNGVIDIGDALMVLRRSVGLESF